MSKTENEITCAHCGSSDISFKESADIMKGTELVVGRDIYWCNGCKFPFYVITHVKNAN